jgi:hypothetical protein
MLMFRFCQTKLGKKIRMKKKWTPFNYGLTLVNKRMGKVAPEGGRVALRPGKATTI